MRRRWRAGWTRVEPVVAVIVVLTVLGLLAAVLFRVRGPAQRIECAMHLMLIGKAVQTHHDQFKALPSSCIAPGYATWAVQIAPFLEQDRGNGLRAWDLGLSYYEQPTEVRAGQVGVYYCPARRLPGLLSTSGDVTAVGPGHMANCAGALGDYGCAPTSDNAAKTWTSPEADGALIVGEVLEIKGDKIVRWKSRTTLAALERGPEYTILLGEKHVPLDGFGQARLGDGSLYNGEHPPSFARLIDKDHGLSQGPAEPFNLNFGSWHPGVCQFLMADGSLQVFGNGISPEVLQKLVPRALPDR